MSKKRAEEQSKVAGTEQGEEEPEKAKHKPIISNRVAKIFIWIVVFLIAGAAVSTRNIALIILAVLAPGVAGILTL